MAENFKTAHLLSLESRYGVSEKCVKSSPRHLRENKKPEIKPTTRAATQAVVTAIANVSAEYINGPSIVAPITGPENLQIKKISTDLTIKRK